MRSGSRSTSMMLAMVMSFLATAPTAMGDGGGGESFEVHHHREPRAPRFRLRASSVDLAPYGSTEMRVVAIDDDGLPPRWSYAWDDGQSGVTRGALSPRRAPDGSRELYTPANCVLLGGGDQPINVSVTVTDSSSGLSRSASLALVVHCPAATFYTTKTPYRPQEDAARYEPPPSGFAPVLTELVARHGSRGLSSMKYDAAAYNMAQQAAADGALTPLGTALIADIVRLMKANVLLGFGVAGIKAPGYGNLTQVGIGEHRQLAARLLARLPGYFADIAATAGTSQPRSIVVVSSGVDRAVDSSAFFAQALAQSAPALAPLLAYPPAPAGYPAGAPILQPPGTNRFLLYFHKLVAKTDLVTDATDPFYSTYQDSLAFQAYASDPVMNAKVSAILAEPVAVAASRAVLERLFTAEFVDKIDSHGYTFANTGTFTFTSDDGLYTNTVTGDGKTTIASLTDAASMLYNLYVIAPAMIGEAGVDFTPYIPREQARDLAYLQDAQDFYEMGPGIEESNPVTYKMAQALEDDFFAEIDSVAAGDLAHAAKLRFTHAEIITPFASLLGLQGIFVPVPQADTYTYDTNPWRGEIVSPMAANVQWDVYGDGSGALLVRMLYNEREVDFKATCDGAKHRGQNHYYDYAKLKTCYGHIAR